MAIHFNLTDFDRELSQRLENAGQGDAPKLIVDSMNHSLLAPGKRIRPRLLCAVANLFEVSNEASLPFALALEMYHCSTLIHDDLPCMDDDDERRGKPANHKVYGEAIALLAGDSLVTSSWQTLLESFPAVQPSERFHRAATRFGRLIGPEGVIGGQVIEIDMEARGEGNLELVSKIFRMKTGALFEAAILIPADLAGVSTDSEEWKELASLAEDFGYSFQALDDLEDHAEGQDRGSAKNIVSHQSIQEIKTDAENRLRSHLETVASLWPDSSADTLGIIEELLGRINRYSV